MNIPKLKDLVQKVGFLKNYSSLLVPIVIALVGIFLFMPAQLMRGKFKKQIETESITLGRKIKSLSSDAVVRDQWKVEQEYQKEFAEDANKMATLMKQSTQRPLLSYKIFPEPKETSTLIFKEFGQRYREAVEEQLARANAHDCPTEVEIERNLQRSSPAQAGWEGSKQSDTYSEVDATIIDALCKAKARSSFVYVNPLDLAGYAFWEKYEYVGMEQAIQDCWFWQLGYWVIEDVVDTIAVCNSSSNNVFESPVKRLLYVDFAAKGGATGGKTDIKPSYVLSDKDAIVLPYTARVSNDDIDVIHFELAVVVRVKDVLLFMKQLCSSKTHNFGGFFKELDEQTYKHNQITILKTDIEYIDLQEQTHQLYRYGDDAVVKLSLVCEYIFDKNGYNEIKPVSLKPKIPSG